MARTLDVVESEEFVERYGVKFCPSGVAETEEEAVALADKMGYPVVMKIVSRDIVHKTDVNGVRVWIDNEEEVREVFRDMLGNARAKFPNAVIKGVQVQKQKSGYEIIVGSKRDPQFGPTIMFGLGGVFVEVLEDVAIRVCPITRRDAEEMVMEIKGYEALKGVRGRKPADLEAIEDVLLRVSDMLMKEKDIQELDLNPMFANHKGVVGADARVVLKR